MAITGTLLADFSDFDAGVKKSAEALRGMEGGAAKVEAAVDKMAGGSVAPLNSFRESVGQVDQALAASGLNVGKYARGFAEIGDMAGKTVSQIGALAAGAGIASAAMAGIQFGTWIRGWADTDEWIRKATVSVGLFADVAAETSGAMKDTINRAIADGAKDTIKYNEAIEFNAKAAEKAAASRETWTAAIDHGTQAVANLTNKQIAQIQADRDLGATQTDLLNWYGLTAEAVIVLDNLVGKRSENEKQLAKLQTDLAKAHEDRVEKAAKLEERAAAQTAKLYTENAALEISMGGTRLATRLANIEAEYQAERAHLHRRGELNASNEAELDRQRGLKVQKESVAWGFIAEHSRQSFVDQVEIARATYEEMTARSGEFSAFEIQQARERMFARREEMMDWQNGFDKVKEKSKETTKEILTDLEKRQKAFHALQMGGISTSIKPLTQTQLESMYGTRAQLGLESGDNDIWRKLAELEAKEGTYAPKSAESYFAMIKDQILLSQLRMWAANKDRPPGFAGGVTNFGGGLARVHEGELLVNMPAGTDVIPRGGGGGVTNYHFHMSGMVGDKAGLARTLKQVLVNGERAGGRRLSPAGAVG